MKKGMKWAWLVIVLAALVGLFLIPGGAKETLNVAGEFDLQPILKLPSIGPVDLSVNKAVIYLWLATAVIIVIAIVIARHLKPEPGRFQAANFSRLSMPWSFRSLRMMNTTALLRTSSGRNTRALRPWLDNCMGWVMSPTLMSAWLAATSSRAFTPLPPWIILTSSPASLKNPLVKARNCDWYMVSAVG